MSQTFSCAAGHQWQPPASGGALTCPVCRGAPTLESLGAPLATAAALTRLRDDLQRAAGQNLAGLILYGGLARGRYHPGKSDIKLVVLLHDVSGPSLDAVAPALRRAWRAIQVEPLLLVPTEIHQAAVDFPTKFLDLKAHHIVLAGQDPFAELQVDPEAWRTRIAQSLRNLALRLRRRYVGLAHDPSAVAMLLGSVARPLALELAGLLQLSGKTVPPEDRTVAVFEAAAAAFGLDRPTLLQLADLRREGQPLSDTIDLLTRTQNILNKLIELVHSLKGRP
jgi:hypothetical protein